MGFHKGATLNGKKRYVDFNQGIDLRLLTKDKMKKLLLMPDDYIIYREKHKNDGAADWKNLLSSLSSRQKEEFRNLICENQVNNSIGSEYPRINKLLSHYKKHTSHY